MDVRGHGVCTGGQQEVGVVEWEERDRRVAELEGRDEVIRE